MNDLFYSVKKKKVKCCAGHTYNGTRSTNDNEDDRMFSCIIIIKLIVRQMRISLISISCIIIRTRSTSVRPIRRGILNSHEDFEINPKQIKLVTSKKRKKETKLTRAF